MFGLRKSEKMKILTIEEALKLPNIFETRFTATGIIIRGHWENLIIKLYSEDYYISKKEKI